MKRLSLKKTRNGKIKKLNPIEPNTLKALTNKHLLITLLFFLLSCQSKNKLTIEDLKFPDAYRQSIIENKVESVTFKKNTDPRILYLPELDDGKITYDSLGRNIKQDKHGSFKNTLELTYDHRIFLKRRSTNSDYHSTEVLKNLFVSNSLTLITYDTNSINDLIIPIDDITNYYKFNKNGILAFEFQKGQIDFNGYRHLSTEYSYTEDLIISSLKTNYLLSKEESKILQEEKPDNWKVFYPKTKYDTIFYNGNKISHQHTEIHFVINKNPLYIKTVFDDRGLKVKSIIQDSIVMTYNYSFRK